MPPALPSGLETFVDEVVPLLVRRGLFRSEYEGVTLRDHYGLDRPVSRYQGAPPNQTAAPQRQAVSA
jgi:hypothetical protein